MADTALTVSIIERHAAAFARGDVPGIMADYADDAVLMTKATGVLHGKAAIEGLFTMIFANLFPPATTEIKFEPALAEGGCGLLHWTAETPQLRATGGFDSFFVHNGKIVAQAGGVDIQPRETA